MEHKEPRRHHRRGSSDNSDMITICLSDGPRTVAEIEKQFVALPRRLGFFIEIVDRESIARGDLTRELLNDLEKMKEAGWVERQGERYALTPLGDEKAAERLAGLRKAGMLARKVVQPQTVSQVSLGVHLGLAALKLPAGLLSGSVGLINDATDTLLDGLASLLVYAGLRLNRERAVNVVLVLLMLGTGGLTFSQAVQRFFIPFEPEVNWFAFLAALFSALACLALWGYQRYVGLRSGSVALITQSVDSRNHVIVALSVTVGLIASLLRFSLLDTLVGLAVAILILKSAVELGVDTIRSLREGEVDLSRYRMGLMERYAQFRQGQLRDWMLYLVEKEGVLTRADLRARACQAFDFSDNPALRGFGLDQQGDTAALVEGSLQELYARAWLVGDEQVSVTDAGRERLGRLMRKTRGERHGLTTGGQWSERSKRGKGAVTSKRIETITSRTAEMNCVSRAASSLETNIYYHSDDHLAERLLPGFFRLMVHIPLFRTSYRRAFATAGIYEYVIARTKYIDALFRRALAEQFDQILLLGAGFDTRPLRFEAEAQHTRIFELDAPVTQQAKLRQYRKRNLSIPSNVAFIAIDFDRESLPNKLDAAGFRKGQKSLFVLEGLLMYLEPESVQATFQTIQKYAGMGSRVVFDYVQASVLRHENTLYGEAGAPQSVSKVGEQWRFGIEPGEIASFVAAYGFQVSDHKNAQELEAAYFQDEEGRLVARINGTHCIVTAEMQ